MGQTLAEKIICRAAGRDTVRPGEILTCRVDLAMVHDASGPRRIGPMLERLGAGVWDPDKLVVISDHYVPAVDAASTAILDVTRKWVAQAGVRNFYDMQGICHVVLPERGHLRPGMFVAGGAADDLLGERLSHGVASLSRTPDIARIGRCHAIPSVSIRSEPWTVTFS